MNRVPLDALLRISRMAEKMFDRQGDVDPIWLVEDASGEQHMIVSPIIADSPLEAAETKDRIADKMREHFAEHDIVRYARATEGWTLTDPLLSANSTVEQAALRYAAMGYTLKNHPDRREVVELEAADGSELIWAFRDIIRPSHGKPYLGKMGAIERPEGIAGRFLDLLPRKGYAETAQQEPPRLPRIRFSNELADDVGRVFVTAVPNAPFQLTGRRDPTNGELCVGAGLFRAKDNDDVAELVAASPPWIEVVTGPEAERLILAFHQVYSRQAEKEGLTLEQFLAKRSEEAKS